MHILLFWCIPRFSLSLPLFPPKSCDWISADPVNHPVSPNSVQLSGQSREKQGFQAAAENQWALPRKIRVIEAEWVPFQSETWAASFSFNFTRGKQLLGQGWVQGEIQTPTNILTFGLLIFFPLSAPESVETTDSTFRKPDRRLFCLIFSSNLSSSSLCPSLRAKHPLYQPK